MLETYSDGVFHNRTTEGFQEGAYVKTDKMIGHLSKAGFNKLLLRSVRGIANGLENYILPLQKGNPEYYKTILKIINETAAESAIIETGGHAVFVGEK